MPWGCSQPWEGVQQGMGLVAPQLPCSRLWQCMAEAPVPVPSWDGPGQPNSSGLMLTLVFLRHLSGAGLGAQPGWRKDRPSPCLSSHPPVPMMALSGTRPCEGSWGLLEMGLEACRSRSSLL